MLAGYTESSDIQHHTFHKFTADNDSHGIAGALESQMLLVPVLCNSLAGKRRPMKVLLIAMAVFAVSGASAGLLGIGGALIFNPYLLQLGMDPRVSPQPPCASFMCYSLAGCKGDTLLKFVCGRINYHEIGY